jgi:hypothetical protein
LKLRENKSSGILELINSFNCYNAYHHLAGTRSKPWDDRELDVLDGMKFISFALTTISQTAFGLLYTFELDLL